MSNKFGRDSHEIAEIYSYSLHDQAEKYMRSVRMGMEALTKLNETYGFLEPSLRATQGGIRNGWKANESASACELDRIGFNARRRRQTPAMYFLHIPFRPAEIPSYIRGSHKAKETNHYGRVSPPNATDCEFRASESNAFGFPRVWLPLKKEKESGP